MTTQYETRQIARYRRLVEVSHNLTSTLELSPLLTNIVEVAADLLEAEVGSILLYDQNARRLYFETATNVESSPLLQKLYVPEESIAGWVALNREPQIVNNVRQDARHFDDIDQQVNFSTHSLIAVPMVARQKLIGVLEVLNRKHGQFEDEDVEILQSLAAQAAIAIENSRLFQQSDLIAEFVHELRTPLASIFTASYLMQRDDLAEAQQKQLVDSVYQETRRLNDLTTVFLDLASLESGRSHLHAETFSPLPLFEECARLASIKAGEKNIQVHVEVEAGLADIEADRNKIKQVLLNLLNNAVKYNRAEGQIWLRAWAKNERLYFSVQDTGLGIPADQIHQLFSRFFRARNVERSTPGTGLGLSISQRIVEMHGGQIEVESCLEEGTIFTVQLPQQIT
jgi:signal transduction histidine kinase